MATKKEVKNVTFVGLSKLDPADRIRIKEVIMDHFVEIERVLKNVKGLKLHFKDYQKEGSRKKYSVSMIVNAETGPITINKMSENARWNQVAIVHSLIKKARKEIMHKYKTDSNYRKSYEQGVL